jgi:hypothetical protein
MEIAAHLAQEQGVKFTHRSVSLLPLISNQVGMRELDEHILERRSTLG